VALRVWGSIHRDACREAAVAMAVGCAFDAVARHVTFPSGSFGRKIVSRVFRAGLPCVEGGSAVRSTIRTREEDTTYDVFPGPMRRHACAPSSTTLATRSLYMGASRSSLFGANAKSWLDRTPEGTDESMVDGIYIRVYRLPHFLC